MSDELILPNLEIQGFRAFRKLEIGRFGRINLIVGSTDASSNRLRSGLGSQSTPRRLSDQPGLPMSCSRC